MLSGRRESGATRVGESSARVAVYHRTRLSTGGGGFLRDRLPFLGLQSKFRERSEVWVPSTPNERELTTDEPGGYDDQRVHDERQVCKAP